MSKVNVTFNGLKSLAEHAIKHGTEHAWMNVALDWAEQAEKKIIELNDIIAEKEKSDHDKTDH